MILVDTKIGQSKINGIGIFADQFIPKGTLIWKYMPGFDLKVSKNELDKLSEAGRKQFLKYAYLSTETDYYILCFDDARFFNHSDDPNCINEKLPNDEEVADIAARDIEKGEELTCNYGNFDADFEYKMSI